MGEFDVIYSDEVLKHDLVRLSRADATRIRKSIESKLFSNPTLYGLPLRRFLKGYWKLRVGDYRVVFKIVSNRVVVIAILHRSVVYQIMEKRI